MTDTIDQEGYRANVGIVLVNGAGKLLWARRKGKRGWQFPQGGIDADETAEQAMYRELKEEIGLSPEDVKILGRTKDWLRYKLPKRYQRLNNIIPVIGQKQHWFLLKLVADDDKVKLDSTDSPEFDRWRWVSYWYPVTHVIFFKQAVYQQALKHLYTFLPNRENISETAPEIDTNSRTGDYRKRRNYPRHLGKRMKDRVKKPIKSIQKQLSKKSKSKD